MAKTLQGETTATRAVARQQPNGEPAVVRRRARPAGPPPTGPARPTRVDLDEVLLALQRRAPAATIGPSHWWG